MKKVIITVCRDFGEDLYKKLCNGMVAVLGECEFVKITDESLLGGFTAEFDGVVYDRSIKAKLKQLKSYIEK